jgi:hypothetical protein
VDRGVPAAEGPERADHGDGEEDCEERPKLE